MGHARQERVKLVGTRSADYIRASGHCGCIAMRQASARKQAVYMAAPERFAKSRICSCNAGTVHTWPGTVAPPMRWGGGYWGKTGHAHQRRWRQFVTHLRHRRCNIAVLQEAALTCHRVW